ncbi:hypothetical protein [Streptomyces flavalbus]|uniref:HEAT repeat domain-containing protein n=1 Tax=Streptomyces flavalbus TaxID=2665155 RepID=A0ABW2W7D7_9ACTN
MGALARYARTLTPHAYENLRGALDAGDPGERHTALFLAVVRRDLERVTAALDDPLLGRRARSAALRLPVPEPALERLALHETTAVRHDTYRLLRISRRHALATRLLPTVYERHGAQEAAALLAACPARTVENWLPRLDTTGDTLNSLARTAPRAVAAHLAVLNERHARQASYRFVRRHRAIATTAARRDPDAALTLLARAPDLLTAHGVLAALRRPAAALAVLRAAPPAPDGGRREHPIPAGPLSPTLSRTLRALPVDDLAELAGHCPSTGHRHSTPGRRETAPDGLLRLLPPTERRRAVEGFVAGRAGLSRTPLSTLAALEPDDRREVVQSRLRPFSRRPGRRAVLAAALPLPDGEPVLRELTADHRVHHRAMAWPALLACAEVHADPGEFARIAVLCERAWHDQNEVRHAALRQLAGAPPRLLDALPEQVWRDAVLTTVQSRDSTNATLRAAERLLYRVAERASATGRTERAARAVALLGEVFATPGHTFEPRPLRVDEAGARALWAAAETASREAAQRPKTILVLAELLAPHLAALPTLDAETRRIAVECDDPALAARAAAAWTRPAKLRDGRCGELVGVDPAFAVVPLVLRTLVTRRTDLLDVVCAAAREGFTGRLWPSAFPWVARVRPAVAGRWLPHQREVWSEYHARVAGDEAVPLRLRANAVTLLTDQVRLMALADGSPQPVAAAALWALSTSATGLEGSGTVDGTGLRDLLLRHAGTGGVRGRAAVASLRRLLARLPDPDAVALLTPVARETDAPVGTRKEAARALGALRGPYALDALLAAWDAPRQHPDVRAVLAGALLPAVDRTDVADRLARAAPEPAVRDAVIHARVGKVPETRSDPYRAFLARLVEAGDEDVAVAACAALSTWLEPHTGDAMRTLADTLTAPDRSERVWMAVAGRLCWFPSGPVAESVIHGVVETLTDRARATDPRVRTDALRRLHHCGSAAHPRGDVVGATTVLDLLASALETAGLCQDAVQAGWRLALHAVGQGRYDAHRWDRLVGLCEAGPWRLPDTSYLALDFRQARVRDAVLATARALRGRGTAVSGLLALTLVQGGGRATDWEAPWPAELDALRAHSDPDTAMGALLVEPGTDG